MQVSATLIAAQQAARDARARMGMPQAAPQQPQAAAKANFALALQDLMGASAASAQAAAPAPVASPTAQPSAPARMGQHVNILV